MPNISSADQAHTVMFAKAHNLESLPPSSNVTKFHIQHSDYQTAVLETGTYVQYPVLPDPQSMG